MIAEALPGSAGAALDAAAAEAFVDGLGTAVLFAAALALVGAGVVLRFLPHEHQETAEEAAAVSARAAEAG